MQSHQAAEPARQAKRDIGEKGTEPRTQQEKEPGVTQSSLSSASESTAILSEIIAFVPLQWLQSPMILREVNHKLHEKEACGQLKLVCHIFAKLSCCHAPVRMQLAGLISPARFFSFCQIMALGFHLPV